MWKKISIFAIIEVFNVIVIFLSVIHRIPSKGILGIRA